MRASNSETFSRDKFASFVADCRNRNIPLSKIGQLWQKDNPGSVPCRGSYVLAHIHGQDGTWSCYPAQSQCGKTLASIISARLLSGESCSINVEELDSASLWPKSAQRAAPAAAM